MWLRLTALVIHCTYVRVVVKSKNILVNVWSILPTTVCQYLSKGRTKIMKCYKVITKRLGCHLLTICSYLKMICHAYNMSFSALIDSLITHTSYIACVWAHTSTHIKMMVRRNTWLIFFSDCISEKIKRFLTRSFQQQRAEETKYVYQALQSMFAEFQTVHFYMRAARWCGG